MKIYLFLPDKIMSFSLPKDIAGSFSFDENPKEENKLINIEARENRWNLYTTTSVSVLSNDVPISATALAINSFYVLKRNDKKYLIYVTSLNLGNIECYQYGNDLNLSIGSDNSNNIQYQCPLANNLKIRIGIESNQLFLENIGKTTGIYINEKALLQEKTSLVVGSQINIYGLKLIVLNKILLINNPGPTLKILPTANIKKYMFPKEGTQDIEVEDRNLYQQADYFSKSPRIRRNIEPKQIKINPPPQDGDSQEMPVILTVGPMLTMAASSSVMLINTITRITSNQADIKNAWPQLASGITMLISSLVWPFLTKWYNNKTKQEKKKKTTTKYLQYLEEKKEELTQELNLQKNIINENLISTQECINIIQSKNMNFWSKRIEQNDFLTARIGIGNEKLAVEIEWQEEGFTISEDKLKKQANEMVESFRQIENVPVSYSFYDNAVTAIMGSDKNKNINFVNNILLQFLTFYSYEDLKIVVFTNETNATNWQYIKYLNHNFNNEKNFRFFASTIETTKSLAEYLNNEISKRPEPKGDDSENKAYYKPHYLIIVDDYERVKRYDAIKTITEVEKNIGFSMIILEERLSKLPSKCNNFITLGAQHSGALKNSYEKQEQITFQDEVQYNINMTELAKILANVPIEFEEGLKALPDAISFMEMENVGKVEQLNILNRWKTNDSTISLKSEIGLDTQGDLMYLDLHEKHHGPHGLIAGTTGSGKSEFIITYILSMCINYSPDDVAFILIDYKGGGLALAFENKTQGISLPHLAGTITNLDKAEMDRTLVSIDSEVKRRQHMFNIAREKTGESTMDIYKYQRHYHEGDLEEPIPHLFIICDEFAELKSQQPEFMDNLISVARIGRSLGVHLILATQKPSGVVNDQIWSNTKFRVCLKVQDESDSKEMLKRPEAASIKQAGRYYLQVGYDELFELGQSGWCGAKYYPSDKIVKQVDKSINFINDCGIFIKSVQDNSDIKIEAQGEQLAVIMKNIIETADKINQRAKKLWLENIPSIILVDNTEKKYNFQPQKFVVEAVMGEYDAPENQEQGLVTYNYLEHGNTIVYSTDSTENEMFLNTLLYSTTKNHTADEINFYIIDYGSESFRKYEKLPHVGGIIFNEEFEKYNNLLKLLFEEMPRRKKLFANYGGEYLSYIKNSQKTLPIIAVIINNFDAFNASNPNAYDVLPELVRDSARYGIVYIFTGSATNSVSSRISQNFANIYAYKLKDSSDYGYLFNSKSRLVPRNIDGRGILNNGNLHEFQTASIVEDNETLNSFMLEYVNYQNQINTIKAPQIPHLPKIVRLDDIKSAITTLKAVPVGIEKNTLNIHTIDYTAAPGNLISSTKLENMFKFTNSLLYTIKQIPSITTIIIDPSKLLNLDKNYYQNYYTEEMKKIIDGLNEQLEKLIESKSTTEGIILIYNLNKFITSIEDKKKIEPFFKNIKKYEKISVIAVEETKKLKDFQYEAWFTNIFGSGNGLWIGKGISDQSIIKTSSYSKELQVNYKNDMGFSVIDGDAILVRYIDFISKDEEEENE